MTTFDPLDMNNYRIEKLPKRDKGPIEKWFAFSGPVLALTVFILFAFVIKLPFLHSLQSSDIVTSTAKQAFDQLGAERFIRNNEYMLAIFLSSIILWMTQAIPNYLTSLMLIISLVLTGVLSEKTAYAQLGHPVMWLNIMSFVLASMLVVTGLAKRFALLLILKFGKNASTIFLSFIVINMILSAFISATTAKAAILLPIFMVIAAVYGAQGGKRRNNFGRSIVLQNLFYINVGAGAFVTGSGANLIGAAIIGGAISGSVFFADWMLAMFPFMLTMMFIGYVVAMKVYFPLSPEERLPQIAGGMDRLREEYAKLGPVSALEKKSALIFVTILGFWATDSLHGISPTAVAFIGAIVALTPKYGIVQWNEVDVPWHLMLFSAGAYALGSGLDATDLPAIIINAFFNHLGIGTTTHFWILYLFLTAIMIFSALLFESKTMRAMIFIPIAIGVAKRFGFEIISLALPVAFMIEHVYVLPFNSKPAALLYETDHYSLSDTFKFGITMMVIAWLLSIIAGETWFRFLGITPQGVFGLFS